MLKVKNKIKKGQKMYRIMFVCHGNICRSPMAELIFKDKIKKKRVENLFEVSSSAVSGEEIGYNGVGNPIYPPAVAELRRHNIPVFAHRATRLLASDYEKYDLFIGMDDSNINAMKRILNGDKDNKVKKLLDFVGFGYDVFDPWYSGRFDVAYNDIENGCEYLLDFCLKNMK